MRHEWGVFVTAWRFLTIVPLPGGMVASLPPGVLAASFRWFPVVGFVLGAGLVVMDRMVEDWLDIGVRNMVLLVFLVWVTGGLHQDGLSDTVDALGGGRDSEHRLAILRDSRIGALGATGLILALGLRFAGLAALPNEIREAVLLSMPALGRWSMVLGSWRMVYPRAEGLAASFLRNMTFRDLLAASGFVAVGFISLFGWLAAAGVLVAMYSLVRLLVMKFSKLFGGITGDLLGTINECVEILFLLAAPVAFSVI